MKKTTFLIVGKHAVVEALKNPSRKIERVFVTEDAQKKLNRENQSLNLFKNTSVFYKSRRELDNLCGRDETAHQGLVAEVEQLEEITLKEFIIENKNKNINLIALEEVTDPRNIGSIIRSAVAFNIDGIIGQHRKVNLLIEPFNLNKPSVVINDGEKDKFIFIFERKDII